MKLLPLLFILNCVLVAGCAQRSPVGPNHVSRIEAVGIVTRLRDPQMAEGRVPFDSSVAEENYYIDAGAVRDRPTGKDKQ